MSLAVDSIDWASQAPCAGRLDEFFPSKTELSSLRVRRARRVCLTECPFRRECLQECFRPVEQYVIVRPDEVGYDRLGIKPGHRDSSDHGLWGGTTPQQRRAVSHLPIPERIELLLAWVQSDTLGPWAPATKREVRT